MERLAYSLMIAYGGGSFAGWQRQVGRPSVQATLEAGLAALGVDAKLVAAARTDAGVHARRQVVSFRVRQRLPLDSLLPAVRGALPRSLRVLRWVEAPPVFHARNSVRTREYRYRIFGDAPGPAPRVGWRLPDPRSVTRSRIDLGAARAFLSEQLGRQDRRRFTTRPIPGRDLETTLLEAEIRERAGSGYELRFVGDRFTRHLVRNWVGAAATVGTGGSLPIGTGGGTEGWHGVRAPSRGLILWEVALNPDPFRSETAPPPAGRS